MTHENLHCRVLSKALLDVEKTRGFVYAGHNLYYHRIKRNGCLLDLYSTKGSQPLP